jgi:PKD repeat protein
MNKATRSNFNRNRKDGKGTRKVDQTKSIKPAFESLEDRRLLSQVSLVNGMLVITGNANGLNRLGVSPDSNGTTLFARANNSKAHYQLKDVKSIHIVGGNQADKVVIESAIKKSAYIKTGKGRDYVSAGSGSDTILGGSQPDTLMGGTGDDLIVSGGQGADKVDAGAGDDPSNIWPHKSTANPVSVASFTLIDATTNQAIATLNDGSKLNLATLPKKLNVRANLSVANYDGSVRFAYDGQPLGTVENVAPYALSGDSNGDFKSWEPKVGPHTLQATPYAGLDASGAMGTEKIITFTVINDPDAIPSDTGSDPVINPPVVNPPVVNPPVVNPPVVNPPVVNPPVVNPPVVNPPVVDQKNAPTAVITALDTSVPEGMAVHVNGIASTLKVGDALSARYEWDFGDAGSKYNKLVGFNAAHAYTKAGTYTITLKVTNSSGVSNTVTKTVTITPAGRRFVYVSPTGNDANNGSSQANAVKTFKRASQLVGDNTEVLFQRGGTYTTSGSMSLGHSNVVVGAYGTGAAPIVKYTGGANYGTIFTTLGGKDVLVKNLTFDSSNTSNGDQGYNDAIRMGGANITLRDCSVTNAGYVVNTNGHPDGVLVQDNIVTKKTGMRGYFAWVQGADMVFLGNTVPDSLNVHLIRIGGGDRILIAHNDLTNLSSTAARPTVAVHKASYVYVANNKLTDSCVEVGPLDGADGLKNKADRTRWVVLENNAINDANIDLRHGIEHLAVRNNVIKYDGGAAIDLYGYNTQYGRGSSDVYIMHNTAINNKTMGRFLKVGGSVNGVTLCNNLYVAPNFCTNAYDAAPVWVADSNLNSFREISDNVWPMPNAMSGGSGINKVGAYVSATKWEAYSQVVHDQFKDVTLTTCYMVSLDGITAGADMAK